MDGKGIRKILKGIALGILAVGQLCFSFIFIWRLYVVSQADLYKIDSRWVLPPIALASFLVFAVLAWRSFVPARKG